MYEVHFYCHSDIEVMGVYERVGGRVRLVRWRIKPGLRFFWSEWHIVHGNQKRDIGVLPLWGDKCFLDNANAESI